jgi:precorrin-2 dehydrogenase/sirohydrochlorin ferrochelatase
VETPPSYPVQLHAAGWRAVVVGGGEVALRKTRRLLESGVVVAVVAPALCRGLADLAAAGTVAWCQRSFDASDLEGARLAFAATDDAGVNRLVAASAQAAGVLVDVADAPELGSFHLPAAVRRSGLQVTVSTGGRAPFLARRLRERIERRLGPEWDAWIDAAERFRADVRRHVDDPVVRSRLYDRFVAATLPAGAESPAPIRAADWRSWIAAAEDREEAP